MNSQIKTWLQPPAHSNVPSLALLLFRSVIGIAFMIHGWEKIQHPTDWMGPQVPGVFQFLGALAEFGGGLAWVLGLLTPLAALGIGGTMAVAFLMNAILKRTPFVSTSGEPSYEMPLVYFTVAMVLLFVGAGKYSLDYKLFGSRKNQ